VGAWSLLLAAGLGIAFVGLFTHWSLILLGALLPFVPLLRELRKRRRDAGR
jgi:hypothetical protein